MQNILVKLEAITSKSPLELASRAARICYQNKIPDSITVIDVRGALFLTGHHTTLQHQFYSFIIDGISVGDVTFGLHLVYPFYNTDQRSGRFCAEMFSNPDFQKIRSYIKGLYPELSEKKIDAIIDYAKLGLDIYARNIDGASLMAARHILDERPNSKEEYINVNAPKIAQEQMRMFVPVIFPTGLLFTVNLSALAAMWRTAWTPSMRYVVSEMVKRVLDIHPELAFMFPDNDFCKASWSPKLPIASKIGVSKKPSLRIISVSNDRKMAVPGQEDMHPVDLLSFSPRFMANEVLDLHTEVELSMATMGQDQRHRRVRRGEPSFSGNFYLPPIPALLGLEADALKLMRKWLSISRGIPSSLASILAPYGAMVKYEKRGCFNAIIHEQAKRLCWCAQEEIYYLGVLLRKALLKKGARILAGVLAPKCLSNGVCAEGKRYCGRNLGKNLRKPEKWFPRRKV